MDIKLNVYDREGNITKTVEAKEADLYFGSIRSIMELLNIESMEDTADLLKVIYNAWDELVVVLNDCFPEMTYEDWRFVKLKELIPEVMNILYYSFGELLTIPKSGN